ncbi:MAG: 3'(2'),5'-bisphosphate nucleotidase [Phycisphaerales bacterium]|jgi:3'(2'), 5'-bisphosphate nucleotidase|nr:3'(2'),5'-bisphosphate nucleotidase [Phycisphaerales bacterium]
MMDTERSLLHPAVEAVAIAATVTRAVQASRNDISQHAKDDRSPVTVADYAAQAIVAMVLADRIQSAADRLVVGEEHAAALRGDDHAAVREAVVAVVRTWRPHASETDVLEAIDSCSHDGSAAAYWTLDPVDGTKGFLRGQQYAIALGRIRHGQVTLGVLGCPNLPIDCNASLTTPDAMGCGSLYAAARGEGAWEYPDASPDASPIRINCTAWTQDRPVRVCASVEAAHSSRSDTDTLLASIDVRSDPVRLDSQAKYAVLARGQADAYLRLPTSAEYREKIWDHAAGCIIATEAGAVVTDICGNPLDFGHGSRLEENRGIIAAAAGLHPTLVEASRTMGLCPS